MEPSDVASMVMSVAVGITPVDLFLFPQFPTRYDGFINMFHISRVVGIMDGLNVIAAKHPAVKSDFAEFRAFSSTIWLLIFLSLISAVAVNLFKSRRREYFAKLAHFYFTTLFAPGPSPIPRLSLRSVGLIWLFTTKVLTTCFSSDMFSLMINPPGDIVIDSFYDLMKWPQMRIMHFELLTCEEYVYER